MAANGSDRPFVALDADHVGVAHDDDGPLGAVALDARDEIGAIWIEREDLVGNARAVENRLEIIHGLGFVARGIAGVDADQRREVIHGFRFELGPIHRIAIGGASPEARGRGKRRAKQERFSSL